LADGVLDAAAEVDVGFARVVFEEEDETVGEVVDEKEFS